MSLARLVVTAVRVEGRSKSEVARDYIQIDAVGEGLFGGCQGTARPTMPATPKGCGREWVGLAGYRRGRAVRSQPAAGRRCGREWAILL
jgi:hypothetical protein